MEIYAVLCTDYVFDIRPDVYSGGFRHVKAAMDDSAGIWTVYAVFMRAVFNTLFEEYSKMYIDKEA